MHLRQTLGINQRIISKEKIIKSNTYEAPIRYISKVSQVVCTSFSVEYPQSHPTRVAKEEIQLK